jgi:dephospho-CoA kinase
VAKYFESTGYPVLFMDSVGHEVLESDFVKETLTKRFGNSILGKEGTVDRKKLGTIVFSDQANLKFLNETMHPVMNDVAKKWIFDNEKKNKKICFIEAAILFEMKMDKFLNKILFVDLAEKEIVRRTMIRSKKTENQIKKIISTQYVKEEKIDYVIDNSGTKEELYKQCSQFEDDVLESLRF